MENLEMKNISTYIDYIQSLEEPSKIIDDEKAYSYFYQIKHSLSSKEKNYSISWEYFTDKKCYDLFAKIIYHFFTIRNKLDLTHEYSSEEMKEQFNSKSFMENVDVNCRRLNVFEWVIRIINDILSKNLKFGYEINLTI